MDAETHQRIRAALIKKMKADHPEWTDETIHEECLQVALGRSDYVTTLHQLLME